MRGSNKIQRMEKFKCWFLLAFLKQNKFTLEILYFFAYCKNVSYKFKKNNKNDFKISSYQLHKVRKWGHIKKRKKVGGERREHKCSTTKWPSLFSFPFLSHPLWFSPLSILFPFFLSSLPFPFPFYFHFHVIIYWKI